LERNLVGADGIGIISQVLVYSAVVARAIGERIDILGSGWAEGIFDEFA
jgi:hypothetical protein